MQIQQAIAQLIEGRDLDLESMRGAAKTAASSASSTSAAASFAAKTAVGSTRYTAVRFRPTLPAPQIEALGPAVAGSLLWIAALTLAGGLGYVPVTFTGLPSNTGHKLIIDGQALDQATHGNDFWQTDYDAGTQRWSQTFNVLISDNETHTIRYLTNSE